MSSSNSIDREPDGLGWNSNSVDNYLCDLGPSSHLCVLVSSSEKCCVYIYTTYINNYICDIVYISTLCRFSDIIHVKCLPLLASNMPLPRIKCFPDSSAGKKSTCNAGDLGSIPGLGRSPGEGKGYLFQYSGLENSRTPDTFYFFGLPNHCRWWL